MNRHAGRRGRRVGGKVRRRTAVAAAVLHGRYNAGAADEVLLAGRRRKVQLVKTVDLDETTLTEEDRAADFLADGTETRILLEVGAGRAREQHTLWPGDVLVAFLDPRVP